MISIRPSLARWAFIEIQNHSPEGNKSFIEIQNHSPEGNKSFMEIQNHSPEYREIENHSREGNTGHGSVVGAMTSGRGS
jgi:hypothetical protein